MSFNDFRVLVQSKFDFPVSLERPYKICDFKPAFGLICSEYIQGYDFWGHCDFDMIFGDIRKYITDDLLNSYDKILPLGHLSIYRNNEENNSRFKLSGSLVGDYKKYLQLTRALHLMRREVFTKSTKLIFYLYMIKEFLQTFLQFIGDLDWR